MSWLKKDRLIGTEGNWTVRSSVSQSWRTALANHYDLEYRRAKEMFLEQAKVVSRLANRGLEAWELLPGF